MDQATATVAVAAPPAERPAGDRLMRRLLRIPEAGPKVRESETHRIFGISILLSATRCLLSYIVLPIVLPAVGLARGVGPAIGIPVGVLALVFDYRGIRRFWLADHHNRWAFTALYAVVGTLVAVLVAIDVAGLLP